MSLRLVGNSRQEMEVLIEKTSGNLVLVDQNGVAADRSHPIDLMHMQLSARTGDVGNGNKDGKLKPAFVIVANDAKHVIHINSKRGDPITSGEAAGSLGNVTDPGPACPVRDTLERLTARVVPLAA
eukprot:7825297-Heterocapsa_arctica.AAC.1